MWHNGEFHKFLVYFDESYYTENLKKNHASTSNIKKQWDKYKKNEYNNSRDRAIQIFNQYKAHLERSLRR